jgi:mono/diheme cytochrome c family protein
MADFSNTPVDEQNLDDPHNRAGLWGFMFSMVFVFAFFIYIVMIHPGIDLGENLQTPDPNAKVVAAVDVSGVTEPWKPNPDMVTHGQKVYKQNCALCHGDSLKGDGPGAGSAKPRNLISGPWKKGGGYIGLYTVMLQGIEGTSMSAYKHLSKNDRWAVVQYIESLTEAKVQEDPAKVEEFAKSAE